MAALVSVEHERFGPLSVPESRVLHFGGIPGFPDADRFAVIEREEPSRFVWLACLDLPDLAFVVADPRAFFEGYPPPLEPAHLEAVGAERPEEVDLLTIACVRDGTAWLNLSAPLIVNAARQRGAQVILDGPWPTRAQLGRPVQMESKPQT